MRRLPDLGPRGEGWVLIQGVLFLAILAGAWLGGGAWDGPQLMLGRAVGFGLGLAGFLLAVRGVFDLRTTLTPFPKPLADAQLVESGAYRLARHPIYGGLILAAIGAGFWTASPAALLGAVALLGFFDLKSRREERWLAEKFEAYPAYRARTRRLIPWVY